MQIHRIIRKQGFKAAAYVGIALIFVPLGLGCAGTSKTTTTETTVTTAPTAYHQPRDSRGNIIVQQEGRVVNQSETTTTSETKTKHPGILG